MSSFTNIPSTASVLSVYTSVAASTMLVRTIANEVKSMVNQFIPQQLQTKIITIFGGFYGNTTSQMTLIINQYDGHTMNQVYEASEIYLRTKINNHSLDRLIVSKHQREKSLIVMAEKDQDIVDVFQGIQVKWKLTCIETDATSDRRMVNNFFELSFHKKCKETVLSSYLPYVLRRSKAISEENRVLKLYTLGNGSVNLDHPATFDTLAMDAKLKKEILEDLDRFVKRREFYKRAGKPWKRGYLLYGPPGTGKSSLIAAMANYLKFNICDLELMNLRSNSELRRLLLATANKSILVIEDIDCGVDLQNRSTSKRVNRAHHQLTLSGLLNFIDGLWSSCGDERLIVFTTNHKDRLDPALLRPGRMDMHINMSYCTPCGFKILASNYLQIEDHKLLREIDILLEDVNATPAEIAEELMKSDDAQTSLQGVISFLLHKKIEKCETKIKDEKNGDTESEVQDDENENANSDYEISDCW